MPAMSDAEIRTALTSLPAWNVVGGELTRQFRFRDFVEAFGFMAQVERFPHPSRSQQVECR